MKSKVRIAFLCAVAICLAGVLWMTGGNQRGPAHSTYSQFLEQVRSGKVASVTVIGSNSGAVQATYWLKGGYPVRTVLPSDYRDALLVMQEKLVNVEIRETSAEPFRLLMNAAPFFLLLACWIFLMLRKPGNRPRLGAWT